MRNRTLGLDALASIDVPVPSIEKQRWFAHLHSKVEDLSAAQESSAPLWEAMLPATLERIFQGQLDARRPEDATAVGALSSSAV
jgi:type I restriction enzyme, S subunit